MKVITIANNKGGTSKSTTACCIATGTKFIGKKALAIDLDPQFNLTYMLGAEPGEPGAFEILTGKININDAIQHTPLCDVISGNESLEIIDTLLKGDSRINALKDALLSLKTKYDYVVIDTSASFNLLLYNALVSSDEVIIPIHADIHNLQGLYKLHGFVSNIQEKYNPGLKFKGVLFTNYEARTIIAKDMTESIIEQCKADKIPVFKTKIRRGVAVQESQTLQENLFEYAPKSKPTLDYMELLKELKIAK